METDLEYFRRRAREEREAALGGKTPAVRLRHLEFANAYEVRVREIEAVLRRSFSIAAIAS
jgi:hypothetical protein